MAFVLTRDHPHTADGRAHRPYREHGGVTKPAHRVYPGLTTTDRREDQHHAADAAAAVGWGTTPTHCSEPEASLGEDPHSEVTCIFICFQNLA